MELARGLTNYSSKEMSALIGKKSEEIDSILGYHGPEWVISRDNYALLTAPFSPSKGDDDHIPSPLSPSSM